MESVAVCCGAGSVVVCGKHGKTDGGWLDRAVRRFHPVDRWRF